MNTTPLESKCTAAMSAAGINGRQGGMKVQSDNMSRDAVNEKINDELRAAEEILLKEEKSKSAADAYTSVIDMAQGYGNDDVPTKADRTSTSYKNSIIDDLHAVDAILNNPKPQACTPVANTTQLEIGCTAAMTAVSMNGRQGAMKVQPANVSQDAVNKQINDELRAADEILLKEEKS